MNRHRHLGRWPTCGTKETINSVHSTYMASLWCRFMSGMSQVTLTDLAYCLPRLRENIAGNAVRDTTFAPCFHCPTAFTVTLRQ